MQRADISRGSKRNGVTRSRSRRAVASAMIMLVSIVVAVGANPSVASGAVQPDNILSAGETLRSGDEIHSPNGRYRLVMQADDSNLVLYDGNTPLWATYKVGAGGARLVVQHDSNVVVYRGNEVLWHTVTHGQQGPVSLVLQDDGNLVLYGPYGDIWSTGTGGQPRGYQEEAFRRDTIVKLPAIGVCARVKWTGSLASVFSSTNRNNRWQDISLLNPSVEVVTYRLVNDSCTSTRQIVGKVRVTQSWSGYDCSFDPAIGISYRPWGLSLEGWVDCGKEWQAERSTEYTRNLSLYRQSNSGSPVDFGTESTARRDPAPCYGTVVDLTIWNIAGNRSDSNNTTKVKVCL